MTALELRRQSLIPQLSSQEAVDIINKVNPPVNTNNKNVILRFIDTFKKQVFDQNPHLKKAAISGFSCISFAIKDLENVFFT